MVKWDEGSVLTEKLEIERCWPGALVTLNSGSTVLAVPAVPQIPVAEILVRKVRHAQHSRSHPKPIVRGTTGQPGVPSCCSSVETSWTESF